MTTQSRRRYISRRKGGQGDVARILLGCSADLTPQDKNGWTPLHPALQEGREDFVHSSIVRTSPDASRSPHYLLSSYDSLILLLLALFPLTTVLLVSSILRTISPALVIYRSALRF